MKQSPKNKKRSSANVVTEVPQSLVRQPIRIGCAGWNIPRQFATSFVPGGSHLERYAQTFNACEINSSFYRPHKNPTWERWAKSVPSGFQFSVKIPKTITHEARLECSSDLLTGFLKQIKCLGKKLGPILVQLPPSLQFDQAIASKFLSLLRRKYSGDVVWEPRHATWFDDRVNNLLKDFNIARVAADPACVSAAAIPGGALNLAYFRLHGSPRLYFSEYENDFLERLQTHLAYLSSTGRVWCIFDNTAWGFATRNALDLNARLKCSGSSETRGVA